VQNARALSAITETAVARDSIRGIRVFVLTERAVATGAAQAFRTVNENIVESASAKGEAIGFGRLSNAVKESAVANDYASSNVIAYTVVAESAVASGRAPQPLSGIGWTASSDTFAMSRYERVPFNSIATINGKLYALSDDGLYLLEGANDQSLPIQSSITTGLTDIGSPEKKRVREIYLGYESPGTVDATVYATGTGSEIAHAYTMEPRAAFDPTTSRIKVGRGLRSRYWRFKISSDDDFKLSEVRVVVEPLSRKI
jgi:hypothetical protein